MPSLYKEAEDFRHLYHAIECPVTNKQTSDLTGSMKPLMGPSGYTVDAGFHHVQSVRELQGKHLKSDHI